MECSLEKAQSMIDHLAVVNKILEKYEFSESRLIPILQEVQEAHKYLSSDVIAYVADSLGVPASRVYGVATFYAHFALAPKGKHIFRLCDGTACHVKKSHGILNALRTKLGLQEGKDTSADLMFTVETVSCLGACGLAPVMLFDGAVYGQTTPEQACELIDKVYAAEPAK